jgi:hypothetical protein
MPVLHRLRGRRLVRYCAQIKLGGLGMLDCNGLKNSIALFIRN